MTQLFLMYIYISFTQYPAKTIYVSLCPLWHVITGPIKLMLRRYPTLFSLFEHSLNIQV